MKKTTFTLAPSRYYSVILVAFVLVCCYFFRITELYYAFLNYEQFLDAVSQVEQSDSFSEPRGNPLTEENAGVDYDITSRIMRAIRHDSKNAGYYAALGEYLYGYYEDIRSAENHDLRGQGLREAELWLQKALRYNPANPWYYYDLGRLSLIQGDCSDRQNVRSPDKRDNCPAARYFLAALYNAPNTIFLRRQIGLWYYNYDQDLAFQMMREIIDRTAGHKLDDQELAYGIAEFLYDMHLDYQADLAYPISKEPEGSPQSSEACQPLKVVSGLNRKEEHVRGAQEIEFGSDDDSPEWRTFLASEETRVKKVLCLPKNLDEYTYAGLKVFMNHGGSEKFVAQIYINDHLIKQYDQTDPVPYMATWHEIPFDKLLLQGQSRIYVYIRVSGATRPKNCLQIWGDQDTPTTHSVFNFNTVDDLSYADGIQTGEYMIRLVVRREVNISNNKSSKAKSTLGSSIFSGPS
jgi:tetratricopeptide (TPR) repeat protein